MSSSAALAPDTLAIGPRAALHALRRQHQNATDQEQQMTEEHASNRAKALPTAIAQIEKAFGKGSIVKLGDPLAIQPISVFSTGSLGLDLALGVGGVPRGRIIE